MFHFYVYLESDDANDFLKRTFFHPGSTKCEEQKREAREDYEERCEPSFPLFRNTGTRRFCPDIHDWKEFDNYEIGDGYGFNDPRINDRTNKNHYNNPNQYNDRNQYNDQDHNQYDDQYQYNDNKNKSRNRRPTTTISNDIDENEFEK